LFSPLVTILVAPMITGMKSNLYSTLTEFSYLDLYNFFSVSYPMGTGGPFPGGRAAGA
jgi:hypothetical protein